MRGRRPDRLEYLDNLDASVEAIERFKWIIKILAGDGRVIEALAQLGVCETRYYQLRDIAVHASVAALEARPAGRPSRAAIADADYVRTLEKRVQELEQQVLEAEVRAEVALVLPRARHGEDAHGEDDELTTENGVEKKMRQPQVKIRKPR